MYIFILYRYLYMYLNFLILFTFHCSAPYNNSWQQRPVCQGGGDGLPAVSLDLSQPQFTWEKQGGTLPPTRISGTMSSRKCLDQENGAECLKLEEVYTGDSRLLELLSLKVLDLLK